MNTRILIAVLVVLASAPAAAAHLTPADGTDAAVAPDVASPAEFSTETAASDAGDDAGGDDAETRYTRLYVDADDSYLSIKPGESETFTVRVANGEDRAVDVNPHLFTSPMHQHPIEESWVDIAGPDSVDAGGEAEYEVTVTVPESAETADYAGMIAFTNETVARGGQPPRPIHAAYVGADVWREPTVRIISDTYVHAQVESGDSVTRQIVVKNTGDEAVPLSPELITEDRGHCVGSGCPAELDPNWVDVDAPSQVAAGETATVTVTISPDEGAERGNYRAELDLGLEDPNRDDRSDYWQRVNVDFVVWEQPDEAFEKSFSVSEETENVTLTLTPRNDGNPNAEAPGFDVSFVSPDGEVREARRVAVSERGFVDLGGRQRTHAQGDYSTDGGTTEFVYVLDDPAEGEWSVRIMPENTIGFGYELTRDESGDE